MIPPASTLIDWPVMVRAASDANHRGARLVILELRERNATGGVTSVANTLTVYEFSDAGKLRHLDVYVSKRP